MLNTYGQEYLTGLTGTSYYLDHCTRYHNTPIPPTVFRPVFTQNPVARKASRPESVVSIWYVIGVSESLNSNRNVVLVTRFSWLDHPSQTGINLLLLIDFSLSRRGIQDKSV